MVNVKAEQEVEVYEYIQNNITKEVIVENVVTKINEVDPEIIYVEEEVKDFRSGTR